MIVEMARFIRKNGSEVDEKGQYKYGSVPRGGMLLTCGGELMRLNGEH